MNSRVIWIAVVASACAGTPPARESEPDIVSVAPARDTQPVMAQRETSHETASCAGTPQPRPRDPVAAYGDARAAYDAGRLLEAADRFEAVVRAAPTHEVGLWSAQLSLDALHRAMRGEARGDDLGCHWRMRELVIAYQGLFACGASGAGAQDPCEMLGLLRCEILRVEGDQWVERGEHARASEAYERVHTTGCTHGAEEALYNAAISARRADDPARAQALAAELRRAYPGSSLAARLP